MRFNITLVPIAGALMERNTSRLIELIDGPLLH